MFGKKTGVKIDAQTAITAADNFALTRLCSKMSFTIKPATGITVTGYQLCHVPMGSYITDETSTAYYNPPSAVFKDFSTVTVTSSAGTSVSGINYYMYENLAGKGTNASAETRTATYAPANATYLIVYAKTNDWHSTYRIYLGGANSSDYANYNIPRNYNYNYNINIGGPGIKDVRVICLPYIGNYYYSDGTWGANANPSGKNVIGVIFSDATSNLDKAKGWTHGYAMALKDAIKTVAWGPDNVDTPLSNSLSIGDMDGYTNTQTIKNTYAPLSTKNYPAFYYALNYGVTAPSSSSGWFLPSCGQWYQIATTLGGRAAGPTLWISQATAVVNSINAYLNNISGSELFYYDRSINYWFWCSTESSAAGGNIFQLSYNSEGGIRAATDDALMNSATKNYPFSSDPGSSTYGGQVRPVIAF